MVRKSKFKSDNHKKIARERIDRLFDVLASLKHKDHKLADEYVASARKIAMKFRMRIPAELKKRYCSNCYSYLFSGYNSRIRTKDGKVILWCGICKKTSRYPFIAEQKFERSLSLIKEKEKSIKDLNPNKSKHEDKCSAKTINLLIKYRRLLKLLKKIESGFPVSVNLYLNNKKHEYIVNGYDIDKKVIFVSNPKNVTITFKEFVQAWFKKGCDGIMKY